MGGWVGGWVVLVVGFGDVRLRGWESWTGLGEFGGFEQFCVCVEREGRGG